MYELSESLIRHRLEVAEVPTHMHDVYINYILHGLPPGDFLTAVLCNDLSEACARADEINQRAIYRHVFFLYNYSPSRCWGSVAKVTDWIEDHARQREQVATP